jgi:hypothetical protein
VLDCPSVSTIYKRNHVVWVDTVPLQDFPNSRVSLTFNSSLTQFVMIQAEFLLCFRLNGMG